jgi:segregation and condensation protein B
VVRSLIDRNLLVEVGTDQDAPGSPALLSVTDEFLVATGASSPDDFPPVSSLVTQEELSRVRERLASHPVPPDAGSSEPS